MLLAIIHYLLSTGQVVTKRDIFYQHFTEVKSQRTIDHAVDDIVATLGVSRSALRIIAAVNGMVKGGKAVRLRFPVLSPFSFQHHRKQLNPSWQLLKNNSLEEYGAPELTLVSRHTAPSTQYTGSIPGRNENEAERFSILTMLLSNIHYLLSTGEVVTKSDLFRQHFPEVKTQRTIDRAIDDIAATLGVSRSALGIVAAAKGMVKGGVTITTVDGEVVEETVHSPALIPVDI